MRALERALMPSSPATRLATLRLLVGAFGLVYIAARVPGLLGYALTDPTQFAPVGLARVLETPIPAPLHRALVVLLLPTSVAFLLGFRHQLIAPIHATLLVWVFTYVSSWGMIFHTDNLFVLHVVVLAAAPSADAYAWDSRRTETPVDDGRYGWGPQLMLAITCAVYFLAGIAKLRTGGLHFISGEALRDIVAFDNVRKIELGETHSPLARLALPHTELFAWVARSSLALELLSPLALHPRIGRIWAVCMWSFQVGVLALMAIPFIYPLTFIAFAPRFEVEKLVRWLRRWNDERGFKSARGPQ
jgi:hypothetical protein